MKQKNALYEAYLEKKEENKNKNKMLKKYNISEDENTIIINKHSNKILLILYEIIFKFIKVIIYIGILILVTIGATVLLNEEIRNYVINFL